MNNKFKKFFQIFLPIILGSIVGFIISQNIDYQDLIKPPLAPPKILFPIAWTIIYLLMGISYYLVQKENNQNHQLQRTYYLQLFINLLWSIIFFILKWRLVSVLWILILDLIVYHMLIIFYEQKPLSSYLNIPYAIWISFATYLTIGIYILN